MKFSIVRYTLVAWILSLTACGGGGGGGSNSGATAGSPPAFSAQPANQTVVVPAAATFNVTVTGDPAPTLQWQLSTNSGGTWNNITGATASSYTTPATVESDTGKQYRVIATNTSSQATSTVAALTVNPPPAVAPSFTTQPTNVSLVVPATATFKAAVTGYPTPTLQWQVSTDAGTSWSNIVGATATSYTTPATIVGDSGKRYRVVASNASGSINSSVAVLLVSKGWQTAVLVKGTDDAYSHQMPDVAFDINGNAMAVWEHFDGATNSIWSSRYTAATNSWSTAQIIDNNTVDQASGARIVLDANGNAIAAWKTHDGWNSTLWANRYNATTGSWGTATPIEVDDGNSSDDLDIAIDTNGNALVVWDKVSSTGRNIWFNRYDAGTGLWGTPALIENVAKEAMYPEIAIDPAGNAMAVWQHYDGTRYNIMANRYTAATKSWGTAALIETDNAGHAELPDIGIDANGNAIAVWSQSDGIRDNATACRYNAATNTWGTPTLIETSDADDAAYVHVVVDANGNAVAIWQQPFINTAYADIVSNHYDAATGSWGTADVIDNYNAESSLYPELAIGPNGNALAVWEQREPTSVSVGTNYYNATTKTWGTASLVESSSESSTYGAVAVDANGNGMALFDMTNGIWASRY